MVEKTGFRFRSAALDAHHRDNSGETLRARPISLRLASLLAAFIVASLIFFALSFHYTRKERVSGYLAPDRGIIKVVAPQSGTLTKGFTSKSGQIKRGETLFLLNSERNSGHSKIESTTIDLLNSRKDSLILEKNKQAAIDLIRVSELKNQRRQLLSEISLLREQVVIQDEQLKNAERSLSRSQELVASKYFSESQLDIQKTSLLQQRVRQKELAKSIVGIERELGTLDERISTIAGIFEVQSLAIDRQINEIEQQIADYHGRRDISVIAPVSGKTAGVLIKEGEAVQPGTVLMSIIPEGSSLEALLFVPARAAGFVRIGQEVSLRYQAYPYQKFGSFQGFIAEIDRSILSDGDTSLPYPLKEPSYRIKVRLNQQMVRIHGENIALQPGGQFEADISVDRRRLVDWLFDPIYSVSGKI